MKKTKTQEQNNQNSRILPQVLDISAIFVHIFNNFDQNQQYFLEKCPITQELSQKNSRIIFSLFGEKLTRIFEFSAEILNENMERSTYSEESLFGEM